MPERFIINKIIGEGASSTVYKAYDLLTKQNVAIKVFNSSKIRNNELKIIKELNKHKTYNLIESIENSNNDNVLIFELCESNLITFLNEHELDLKGIKKIMRMILYGIFEIHKIGIIHRDIKLGNILIKKDVIKICDFGLSCFKEENDFSYCGTKDYLAPEICNYNYYDEKIDVYAAGIIFKILLKNIKNTKIDEKILNLIKRMTENNPKDRITAEEGLKDEIFKDLIFEVPNISSSINNISSSVYAGLIYSKKTKYGIIKMYKELNRNTIEMEYKDEKGEDHIIKISNEKVDCIKVDGIKMDGVKVDSIKVDSIKMDENFYTFFFDNTKIDKNLLPNNLIKFFNYLCSYFKILFENTKKQKETQTKKQSNNQSFEISLNTNDFDKNLIKKYHFIKNIGWMIKNEMNFILLLNNGRKIEINLEELEIREEYKKVKLKEIPLEILIFMREFLIKFL